MAGRSKEFGPEHFINRELSWLEFNERVLDQALDSATPLLERLKFFCIFSSNLDEFFEVRVSGVKQQIESPVVEQSIDGLTATETFRAVHRRVRQLVERQYTFWREELMPALAEHGFVFFQVDQLPRNELAWMETFYLNQVRPVLTPLGLDPAHPFPQLLNKSLNIIVQLETTQDGVHKRRLAVVQVPRVLPRLIQIPRKDGKRQYVLMGDLIGHYLGDLFAGAKILGYWRFRVTRNSELYIEEEEAANLLKAVEAELHNRRKGDAVRLELEHDCPLEIRAFLLENLRLEEDDLYIIDGPLNPVRLMEVYHGDHSPELRDPPFVGRVSPALKDVTDLFGAIRERDILLHHPYENFSSVLDFLKQAAQDPAVLAIKQTLYRTGGDPEIVGALMDAVKNGKQVTAVVELKARFDEANNIRWAQKLEEAGVHVVYGLVGYKIHGKMTLVVRRDDDSIRRYIHLSTGNYNPTTARIYTDVGLLTCRPEFGEDATNLFNLLTGVCQFQGTRKLLVAPFELHHRLLSLIEREAENARQGLPARIIAKMNALVDQEVIEALYRASQAGVKIDLIVRGICCLRPKLKGISDNIAVRSIVDRFLEHSRIFYFENALQSEVWVGSSDWMPRNFFRRIEFVFQIEDGNLHDRVRNEILETLLYDNTKVRLLNPDGSYSRPELKRQTAPRRSQAELIGFAMGEKPRRRAAKDPNPRYPRVTLAKRPFQSKR
jgi:polyphosphate kinase